MVKHPGLRLHCIADAWPPFLAELAGDLEAFGKLTPFSYLITDFEGDGSYACERAELHSDFDVNVATGSADAWMEAKTIIRKDPEQFRKAITFLRTLWFKYGTRIEIKLEHPTVKAVPYKRCFSFREMKLYGTETRRMDVDPITDEVKERIIVRTGQPKLNVGVFDEELGEMRLFDPTKDDPWLKELPLWEKRQPLLKYGETPETAHMKR